MEELRRDINYDIVVQHDGDGQYDPAYIKDVIEPVETGEALIRSGSVDFILYI